MKRLAVGILAHVDAGKTTLSEGMLFWSGCLKRLGRVDHKDAFLDTDALERERGITIFSKLAVLTLGDLEITLLDTPGHVDFSGEMERTLQVMDYAVLVISGTDGVQSHTRTLWDLLERYRIPVFLFINKMDLGRADRAALMKELKAGLDDRCVDFSEEQDREAMLENVAVCDEETLNLFLERGRLSDGEIAALIGKRGLFPCFFGSALKLEGVDALLRGLRAYTLCPDYPAQFGAKIFKIARDPQGSRLTYMKITGGVLKVKSLLKNRREDAAQEDGWEDKADQIRIYSGAKYRLAEEAPAGTVCAVTGLGSSRPGEGLGREAVSAPPALEPILTYGVLLPPGIEPYQALQKLRLLEEEEPQLHVAWNERLREIHLQLMGEVQMEILKRLIFNRFGLAVEFGPGNILYRETILEPVEGVGHFEPLRHYAEVHLLLEPGPRGSGLRFDTRCSEDLLDRNWQRLILTHLRERVHLGVLTGSPITDMKLTLVSGRAHEKHTEGGDFRQATYRAVRQGLMCAKSALLEPWYRFSLETPAECAGRAMADIERMSGAVTRQQTQAGQTVLSGVVPAAELRGYAVEVAAYTRGRGKLSYVFKGYDLCHNQDEAAANIGYDCRQDTENTADSVFCAHGAGFVVKWNRVREYMHLEGLKLEKEPGGREPSTPQVKKSRPYRGTLEEDRELLAIFERTYGPVTPRDFLTQKRLSPEKKTADRFLDAGPDYLLVDGYNIIFDWDELRDIARENIDAARQLLMDLLSNYQGFRKSVLILVFDAYKVPGNVGEISRYHNIYVVYTRQAETADAYIEKVTYEIGKNHRVRVATSDGAEQLIILGHGALRVSARAFREEVRQAAQQISRLIDENNRQGSSFLLKEALDKLQTEKGGNEQH